MVRRRMCRACGRIISTIERPESSPGETETRPTTARRGESADQETPSAEDGKRRPDTPPMPPASRPRPASVEERDPHPHRESHPDGPAGGHDEVPTLPDDPWNAVDGLLAQLRALNVAELATERSGGVKGGG